MDPEDRRQSSTHYFNRGKPAENFLRLCRLILTICTDILRDVLSRYIKPADLRSELDKNRHRLEKIMNTEQKKLIYPANGNKALAAKHLDISVMYIILRNICNIPNHQNGWGNPPKTGDNSMAACIERIRIQRNEVPAHNTNGQIEREEFVNRWTELQESVAEIERQVTGGDLYERGVEYLLRCDLNFGKAEKPVYQVENHQVDVEISDVSNSEAGKKSGLEQFYNDRGAGVIFAGFFDELAKKIPPKKINQLKNFIENTYRVDNMASLEQANTASACLKFLQEENLFIPSDVIFMQYLMKKIDCRDLFDKCYRYAEAQKALCFYEKPPGNGFRNIQVHVLGNLTEYNSERIEKIKDTVAAIVGCTSEDIMVGGFSHSNSFFLVLAIKDTYYRKLLDMEQQDKDKLRQLNIDFLIVDLNVIFLDHWKEIEWNTYCKPLSPSQDMIKQMNQQEEEKIKATMPAKEHPSKTNKAIHDDLIKDLCTGFFGNSHRGVGNFNKWKIYYANYCHLPVENGETVFDDICTLQRKRIIGVGEYGVLLDIFAKIDESATRIIKEASDSIRQNNETERKDQREPKYGDTNPYTAKITVRTPDRSKEMHNDIQKFSTN